MTIEIKDNFLEDIHLTQLTELIDIKTFPWYLQKEQVYRANDGCWHRHLVYDDNAPNSNFYDPISEIFKDYLKYVSLCRMTVNLLLRQENPSISNFHEDYIENNKKITTAIFYLNTNNGYTEFQGGDKIDSVRNRLIMFPTNTLHRVIGQTDVSYRIVFNFNFIM
jgi:hypothetical protein